MNPRTSSLLSLLTLTTDVLSYILTSVTSIPSVTSVKCLGNLLMWIGHSALVVLDCCLQFCVLSYAYFYQVLLTFLYVLMMLFCLAVGLHSKIEKTSSMLKQETKTKANKDTSISTTNNKSTIVDDNEDEQEESGYLTEQSDITSSSALDTSTSSQDLDKLSLKINDPLNSSELIDRLQDIAAEDQFQFACPEKEFDNNENDDYLVMRCIDDDQTGSVLSHDDQNIIDHDDNNNLTSLETEVIKRHTDSVDEDFWDNFDRVKNAEVPSEDSSRALDDFESVDDIISIGEEGSLELFNISNFGLEQEHLEDGCRESLSS
eukprot:TRINITY_DN5591_c0_g1_i1.p1 TRINITY_DN5591_c0_g1~~TRINITY_DN5591_c0_g1_i1.p1  ORF type:complete len:318 (+),score=83.50 TRINITY_DN5591_c0_g1_i1:38-991(+)